MPPNTRKRKTPSPRAQTLSSSEEDQSGVDIARTSTAQSRMLTIIPPKRPKPRPYECTFVNCAKTFIKINGLRIHRRTHTHSKPFKCSFPSCAHAAIIRPNVLNHIWAVHFRIPQKEFKNVSREEKERAEQYVKVDQELLDEEEAQIAMARQCSTRRKRRNTQTKNNPSPHYNAFGYERLDLPAVHFEGELLAQGS